ncbi:GyrI-like domain-containing protein [Paenibacillus sp. UNC499MF]|uniref:GyrI-like domain-containing protein n=1 Tax=Paenibacillus sp. UNC499MF TaxID=1502751 RepID=UPI00089F9E82|nr:GyrI-like domain-containing protein [Paenibacillus sp. UNC499MF]SEG26948.1 Predicted transcriptional regulator YdeE, contains AraC-type DNA-binding domain [Paenibacillus sp. UNC499MF]
MNMKSVLANKPSFRLAGVSVRTTNAAEAGPEGKLSQLWQQFFGSDIASRPGVVNPHLIYGLYTDYESDASGEYTALLGHEISGEASATLADSSGLQLAEVPAAKYMVFETRQGPVQEVVPQLWQEIWGYFQNAEEQRTYTGDFEVYDGRGFNPENGIVQIYIAIR